MSNCRSWRPWAADSDMSRRTDGFGAIRAALRCRLKCSYGMIRSPLRAYLALWPMPLGSCFAYKNKRWLEGLVSSVATWPGNAGLGPIGWHHVRPTVAILCLAGISLFAVRSTHGLAESCRGQGVCLNCSCGGCVGSHVECYFWAWHWLLVGIVWHDIVTSEWYKVRLCIWTLMNMSVHLSKVQ